MATSKTSPSGGIPQPEIASREEWLKKRKALLAREKALTKQYDGVSAERRRLPMVKLEKQYEFDGPEGKKTLADLFEGQRQLVVYHFMFDPEWEKGCTGCTGFVDALGDISLLKRRNTNFVLISRAPLAKLEKYKAERGWNRPWYSSFGSDFNYDFHATIDPEVAPVEYNYRTQEEMDAAAGKKVASKGEQHALSVFFRAGEDLFHSYASFARGNENATNSHALLDITPYGRQEDWEDSPAGWPQKPTYGKE